MTKRFTLRAAALCCGVSMLATPHMALAQDAPEAAEEGEIVVTATRDERRLQEVAMSVDVTTGDELQKFNLFDAKDIARLSPGLELTNTTGRNNTTTLRGVTFDPDQGTGPAVQVYLNEAPADPQYVYTALYDIGQIEVLRGPQGTLRGLSSPAGSITIATRRPSFDMIEGYVQGTGTTRSAYNFQGGVSLPLSDKFAIRVAALVDDNRLNQVRNVTRNERSRSQTESARITLGWKPSEDFEAYLTYQYLHAENRQFQQVLGPGNTPITQAPFQVGTQMLAPGFSVPIAIFLPASAIAPQFASLRSGPAADVDDYIAVGGNPVNFRNTAHLINLNADWDLGAATLSFTGAYQDATLDQDRDLDPGNAIVERDFASNVLIPNKVRSAELRLSSNKTEGLIWSAGAFYSKRTGTVIVTQDANQYTLPVSLTTGLFLPIDTRVVVPVDNSTASFNANLRYKSGALTLEGGVRYSIIKTAQTTDIFLTTPGFTTAFPVGGGAFLLIPVPGAQVFPPNGSAQQVGVPAALQNRTYKPFTGGVSASYEISPDLNIYAAYGHSFRAGSAGVSVPVGITNDLILSDSEKTDSFEVGLKGSLMDRRLNFTIAAYYQKFDGYLSRFDNIFYNCRDVGGTCNTAGAPINNATDVPATNAAFSFNYNGDADIKGIEATIDGRVLDNWDIGLNLSYANARYNGAPLPCNDFAGTGRPNQTGAPRITGTGNVSFCNSNGRLAEIPDFNASFNTEVRVPLDKVTPFIRGLFTYRPSFFSERSNFKYDSREILDLYLGIRDDEGRWEVNAFSKNVFNQKKITNISLGNALQGVFDSGYRTINATTPREFGLTGSFRF